jgi:Domain of unknown function (DUF5615)
MIRFFLADADLNRAIVDGLIRRNQQTHFQEAEEIPLEGLPDSEVLSTVANRNCVLVSHDVSTMPHHFRQFVTHSHSPGLILIPQALPIRTAIDSLALISEACLPEDLSRSSKVF